MLEKVLDVRASPRSPSAVARDPELVDHSAYTVLIDQQGKARVLYDSRVQTKPVVHDVRVLLK